ncbi:MAG: hypothetical protein ACKVTZ_05640, partial [Bacteroidia bacterium]
MSKLLFKVAKELNVGTGTIVEHLNKKGFDIDNKPNAKVTDDMFTELSKQFQASVAEKEKADQIVIGSRPMQQPQPQPKKEIPVPIIKRDKPVLGFLQPAATTPPPPVKQEAVIEKPRVEETPKVEAIVERPQQPIVQTPEVVQKPKVVAPPPPSLFDNPPPTAEQAVDKDSIEKSNKHELRGTKVLGKIDLDKKKPAPTPQAHQKPQQQQQQPRGDNNNNRQDQNNNRPRPQHEQPRQQQPAKPIEQPKVIAKVEPVIIPEKIEIKSNEPDMYRADTPMLKGLKILGKIDTNKFEKPVRKKEKDKKVFNQKPGVPGAKPVGAAGATSAEEEAKKRKRKRKKVTPGPITQDSIKQIGQGTGQNRGPAGQGGPRPAGQGTGQNRGPAGQGGPRPAGQGT